MLLTSGQVSVAISSFVVFMFTSALFLSGYVLQQQTVRDLRTAIQPKPTPQAARLYLPTQFAVQPTPSPKANAIEAFERTGDEIEVTRNEPQMSAVGESNEEVPAHMFEQSESVVLDDAVDGRRTQKVQPPSDDSTSLDVAPNQKPLMIEEEQTLDRSSSADDSGSISKADDQPKEKPMSRAERRRKIKEEIMAAGDGEGFKGYKRRQY